MAPIHINKFTQAPANATWIPPGAHSEHTRTQAFHTFTQGANESFVQGSNCS